MHFCVSIGFIFNEQEEYARKICSCIVSDAQILGHCPKSQEGVYIYMDQFRFLKTVVQSNRTSLTSTKGCAVKRMEEGPEAKLPHRGVGVDVANGDYQRTIAIRSLKA